jgi:hypothetical protein
MAEPIRTNPGTRRLATSAPLLFNADAAAIAIALALAALIRLNIIHHIGW